jgi:hypothetical protein
MNNLVSIPFHQHSILTLREGDKVFVAMKPICEAMGLQWRAQYHRLKRDPVLSTCVSMMDTQMPGDVQSREVTFLDMEYLNGWLFGIDANRVNPELRDTIIEYQRECYLVLSQHFHAKPAHQHENYWFRIRPHWLSIRDLVLQGKTYGEVATLLQRSVGSVRRAVKRMVEVGLINPAILAQVQKGIAKLHNLKRSQLWGQQLHLFS